MGAIGAAISGLQSSQSWLDVISNNISNSQTVGFKVGRVSFSDLVSEGLRSPSSADNTNNLGGVNPSQKGLGVQVSTVQTLMRQGATQITGNATDVAVQGAGFFTINKGQETLYTRAGNFTVDNQGNLVTGDGGLVQGWTVAVNRTVGAPWIITTPTLNTQNTSAIGNIQIPNNLVLGPSATTNQASPAIKDEGVIIKGNLDSNTPQNPIAGYGPAGAPNGFTPDATTTFTVYDSLGTAHVMLMAFWQTAATPGAPASWDWSIHEITGNVTPNSTAWNAANLNLGNQVAVGAGITFNPDGSLANNSAAVAGTNLAIGPIALVNGANTPFTFSVNLGQDNNAAPGGIGLRDGLTGDYGDGTYDPTTGVYQPVHTVYTSYVDGYPEGTLTGVSIDQVGGINCSFSNGRTIRYAQLAMTKFENSEGLQKAGGNYYAKTVASGLGQIGTAGSSGFGVTVGGALEASNVDLTVELTNMLIAQRMFESNARVVTSADKILDTLVNLGR